MMKFLKQYNDLNLVRYRDTDVMFVRRQFALADEFQVLLSTDKLSFCNLLNLKITIKVPQDFYTDLASVPGIARIFISKLDGIEASVVHDYLYHAQPHNRDVCDEIFYAMLKEDRGVSKFKAWCMYRAVRLFGWIVWNRCR